MLLHHQINPPGLKTIRSELNFSLTTYVNDLRASSDKTDTHEQGQEGREEDLGLREEPPSHAGGARTCEITCCSEPFTSQLKTTKNTDDTKCERKKCLINS